MKIEPNGDITVPDFIMKPFGGLIPDTVQGRILQELAADPFSTYSPKIMSELVDCSVISVSRSLKVLESRGLLTNISKDRQHPLFIVKDGSRTINALIFLALAWQDDEDGSALMDECIRDYAVNSLGMMDSHADRSNGIIKKSIYRGNSANSGIRSMRRKTRTK